ncbi:hypothetical protein OH458_04500 [Vibrio sp. MarTm2]|uniref:hypothetical protein n=1 Tax=Vibrio sp. MarTm2 TaxID=2998831 RepID=UPI0022CD6F4C|nr:hypothetical protein [Vibrio sp. MarTm2]MDA0127327.1 hypothetical protein [Vibrio sp. MarTm2]
MERMNTNNILMKLEKAVESYGGWFWHDELTGIEELEATIDSCIWDKKPDFEYLALEVLKYLEIIDRYHIIETETIRLKAEIWSDEEEFLYHGGDECFDSFDEYLECKKTDIFYGLREVLVRELMDIHN